MLNLPPARPPARRPKARCQLVPQYSLPNAASSPASRQKPTRKISIPHDRTLYHQRHKIENMFGRLKGRRRTHIPATTAAPTPFSQPSVSQQPSSLDQTMGLSHSSRAASVTLILNRIIFASAAARLNRPACWRDFQIGDQFGSRPIIFLPLHFPEMSASSTARMQRSAVTSGRN